MGVCLFSKARNPESFSTVGTCWVRISSPPATSGSANVDPLSIDLEIENLEPPNPPMLIPERSNVNHECCAVFGIRKDWANHET